MMCALGCVIRSCRQHIEGHEGFAAAWPEHGGRRRQRARERKRERGRRKG
jgi:uncharacterized protein Veg